MPGGRRTKSEEFADPVAHIVELVDGEIGPDRKAEQLAGELFGDGELARAPTIVCKKCRLQMDRRGIPHYGVHSGFPQVGQ